MPSWTVYQVENTHQRWIPENENYMKRTTTVIKRDVEQYGKPCGFPSRKQAEGVVRKSKKGRGEPDLRE